jgi:hypothetical protein
MDLLFLQYVRKASLLSSLALLSSYLKCIAVKVLRRFSAVVLEDSSCIALPDQLAEVWQGCGGKQAHTAAAVKLHTRWELKRGRIQGPQLANGRSSDQASPFKDEEVVPGSLLITDLGYFNLRQMAARKLAGGYTLSRLKAGTALFTREGKRVPLDNTLLPQRIGQMKELPVLVGADARLPMRLLLLRVPKAVADQRREDLLADAQRCGEPISEETLRLADWTMLITDVPAKRLRFEEA